MSKKGYGFLSLETEFCKKLIRNDLTREYGFSILYLLASTRPHRLEA
jgi:hypothetical protein